MIIGVQDVYYEVQDMKRAVAFYRDILGLNLTEESDHWSAMNVGGLRVGLDSTEGTPTPKRAILTLKSDNIRADMKRLRKMGVRFHGDVADYAWGSVVTFEDSEGNLLKLMQVPSSPSRPP